mgnify:CR=1 FL=1
MDKPITVRRPCFHGRETAGIGFCTEWGSRAVMTPISEISKARPIVEDTSKRCSGVKSITANAQQINTITAQVSQGNSHILNVSRILRCCNTLRMRNCETAITRYTSKAMAPELASKNWNSPAGMK